MLDVLKGFFGLKRRRRSSEIRADFFFFVAMSHFTRHSIDKDLSVATDA